ncbi:MAG TPA: CoA transferase [Rhizobiaceae bacterium]|nr:CoA transferase [Rhizobiaceae bacterium]
MLENMKVLSFTHFVQGPAAAQYLADMGADVVKVEPIGGAFERSYGPDNVYVEGLSATFLSVNRNVRSLAVDLKHPAAKDVVHTLIRQNDVVLENYRGGVLDRLGFGYEAVKAIKHDIIYASASGWGSSGPMAEEPGQDLLIQARCGLIAATGNPDQVPTVPGAPIVDQHAAALMAMAITAAYVKKCATGQGTRIESNLLNAGLDLQAESIAGYFSGNRTPDRLRRDPRLASWFLPAPYAAYRLADCFAVISLGGEVDKLAQVIGNPRLIELTADRMANRDEFTHILGEELVTWTYERLDRALRPLGMWYERVQDFEGIRSDPQIIHNGCLQEVRVGSSKATVLAHPVRYDGTIPEYRHLARTIGCDTQDVLSRAGLSTEAIATLARQGVVKLAQVSEAA